MDDIIKIEKLNKIYPGEFQALSDINLNIQKGEVLALLGPNGAGKTTLINTICGIIHPSKGSVSVAGYDIVKDFRKTRSMIGLVPQELTTEAFEKVFDTVSFSRGLFGKAKNPKLIEDILKKLSLWDKKDNKIMTLSGGMKRRVLIAKALSHEPQILFLDEPTAGVDVQLRKDMWEIVEGLKSSGVTIILTTHYIEEAEHIADRIGVINKGQLILVKEKADLMKDLGTKKLILKLANEISEVPSELAEFNVEINKETNELTYVYGDSSKQNQVSELMTCLSALGLSYIDIQTRESSLEEIFVELVEGE